MRASNWDSHCVPLLTSILKEPCPLPGERLCVRIPSLAGNGKMDEVQLQRPEVNEILLDYVTFFPLFSCVSVRNIVHLFANALLERRIILVAENLSTLSSCVMAASNLLQPFHWQHVYIPVLPLVLIDYVTAPMPFFVGVLKSCLPMLETMPLEEVLVLDVENNKFLLDPGFEDPLPAADRKKLINMLKAVAIAPERDSDLQIASCFYQFFCDIFAGYEDFYDLSDLPAGKNSKAVAGAAPEQGYRFDMARYQLSKTPPVRAFLEEFSNSQIMQSFLQESESPERRYRFVSQQEYIQHLSVSHDLEMAEAVRKVGAALRKGWGNVMEAASKKRSEKRSDEHHHHTRSGSSVSSAMVDMPSPIRVPDSENIDIILAREMTAKRLLAQQDERSPGMVRRPTHRQCGQCQMYIDNGMSICPHCQAVQATVIVPLNPIEPPAEETQSAGATPIPLRAQLEERHRRPPPPPPKKVGKKAPPPPPPKPRAKPARESVVPDISTLHLTLSSVFEEDPEDEGDAYGDDYSNAPPKEVAPPPPGPALHKAEIVSAPVSKVATARASQAWKRPGVGTPDHEDEVESPPKGPPPVPKHPRRPPPPPSGVVVASKVASPVVSGKWCGTCGEVACDCVRASASPLPGAKGVASGDSARQCLHCNTRAERLEDRFCTKCGKPFTAGRRASKLVVPAFVSPNERSSRRRACACGADNDITAAQCVACREWF